MRRLLPFIALGLLASCGRVIPESDPQIPAVVAVSAAQLGAVRLPSSSLGAIDAADARAALGAFRTSCRVATTREDVSGLTNLSDWSVPCDAAAAWSDARAPEFFASQFTPVRVGEGTAFATGYFEPEIMGSRTRRSASDVPIYGVPRDLERCWRDGTPDSERKGAHR